MIALGGWRVRSQSESFRTFRTFQLHLRSKFARLVQTKTFPAAPSTPKRLFSTQLRTRRQVCISDPLQSPSMGMHQATWKHSMQMPVPESRFPGDVAHYAELVLDYVTVCLKRVVGCPTGVIGPRQVRHPKKRYRKAHIPRLAHPAQEPRCLKGLNARLCDGIPCGQERVGGRVDCEHRRSSASVSPFFSVNP